MNALKINVIASATALLFLFGLIAVATTILLPGKDFWFVVIAACFLLFPLAIASWNKTFWKSKEDSKQQVTTKSHGPSTWKDWSFLFVYGLITSAIFISIDIAIAHPGISLIFTIGAVLLTVLALPGAVRAWILERLAARYRVNLETNFEQTETKLVETTALPISESPQAITPTSTYTRCPVCAGDLIFKKPISQPPFRVEMYAVWIGATFLFSSLITTDNAHYRIAIIAGAVVLVLIYLKFKNDMRNNPPKGLFYCRKCKFYSKADQAEK